MIGDPLNINEAPLFNFIILGDTTLLEPVMIDSAATSPSAPIACASSDRGVKVSWEAPLGLTLLDTTFTQLHDNAARPLSAQVDLSLTCAPNGDCALADTRADAVVLYEIPNDDTPWEGSTTIGGAARRASTTLGAAQGGPAQILGDARGSAMWIARSGSIRTGGGPRVTLPSSLSPAAASWFDGLAALTWDAASGQVAVSVRWGAEERLYPLPRGAGEPTGWALAAVEPLNTGRGELIAVIADSATLSMYTLSAQTAEEPPTLSLLWRQGVGRRFSSIHITSSESGLVTLAHGAPVGGLRGYWLISRAGGASLISGLDVRVDSACVTPMPSNIEFKLFWVDPDSLRIGAAQLGY